MSLTAMEQLFLQVFERKSWVLEQLHQQVDSYTQYLAYNLLAAGRLPPPWLLPAAHAAAGAPSRAGPAELNGKPIISDLLFPRNQITTPASHCTVFQPPTLPSIFFSKIGVPNQHVHPENNSEAVDTRRLEENHREQDVANQDVADTCAEFDTFSRIQRSRSRQKDLEDRLREKIQATSSKSSNGMQNSTRNSRLAIMRSERSTEASSSELFPDGGNNCNTTSSRVEEKDDCDQVLPTESLEHSEDGSHNNQTEADPFPSAFVALENQNLSCDNRGMTPSNRSAGNVPREPLLAHSRLKGADMGMSYPLPGTHLSVEPKKLQFDGVELSSSMPPACNEPSVLPNPLAHTASRASASLGMLLGNVVEEHCKFSSNAQVDCASSICLQAGSSAKSEQLISRNVKKFDVNRHSLTCSGREINVSDAEDVAINSDPFVPVENDLYPGQYETTGASFTNAELQERDALQAFRGGKDIMSEHLTESTRMLHSAERSSVTSPDQRIGSTQYAGTEREICGFDGGMETNVNSCTLQTEERTKSSRPSVRYFLRSSASHEMSMSLSSEGSSVASEWKRSIASEVHVNRNSRSLCGSPSTRSSSSLNCQVGGSGSQRKTTENISLKTQPSVHYFLRSSVSHDGTSLHSKGRSATVVRKRSDVGEVRANRNSCPKRRKVNDQSDRSLSHSSRTEAVSLDHRGGGSKQRITAANASNNSQPCSLQNNLDPVTAAASSHSSSDILSDSKEKCRTKGGPRSKDESQVVRAVRGEHEELARQMVDMDPGNAMINTENCFGTISSTSNPLPESYDLDQQCQQPSALNASIHPTKQGMYDDPRAQFISDTAVSLQNNDDSADCNETMPELESFSIAVPSDSPTIEERAYGAFCNSSDLATLTANLSTKYKIHALSDMYQSLPTRFEKLMSSLNADETKECSASYDSKFVDLSYPLDGSFFMSSALTSGDASTVQEKSELPLTPSVEKYSQRKLSGRARFSSELMGSNPELTCFRIDEDSCIADEDGKQDKFPGSAHRNFSNQWPTGRIALHDITALHQNKGTFASDSIQPWDSGSPDSMNREIYITEVDRHSDLGDDQVSRKTKENRAPSAKREQKVSQFLRERSSRKGILGNKNERTRSEANLEKGCKPSNIVANMTSFIPFVKQKQQQTAANVKKDVRVKALEVAEAAKRLEEKRQKQKQNEREMRKAAAEKHKQERELKQKQEDEEKRKREADIATRKRQREDDEKKEKEKKRKFIQEARKQQKQPVERVRATIEQKGAHRKASDAKEVRKNLVEGVKSQFKPDEAKEFVLACKGVEMNDDNAVVAEQSSASLGVQQIQENMSNKTEKSYEMTPYKDSDEEGDDMEDEEELRRRRKPIPSWARKECLEKILISNQTLDPRVIFARKSSFDLSEVLTRGFR